MSRRYQYDVYRKARELADRERARVILDVGCGPGSKLTMFFGRQFQVVGIDTAEAVALCRRLQSHGEYRVADFERYPARLASELPVSDLLICADVIEHLENPEPLLRFIQAVSGPVSPIVISTPCRERLLGNAAIRPSNPEHVREWASWELRAYLESSGFEILEQTMVRPFRFRPDATTLSYVLHRAVRRLPLRTSQLLVCRLR